MRALLVVASLIALTYAACPGYIRWRTVYSVPSPDGKAELVVQEAGCFAEECNVRAAVNYKWRTKVLGVEGDCAFVFAHAAWRGPQVSVLVNNIWCRNIFAAFDTATGEAVDFASTEEWLKQSLIDTYSITFGELEAYNDDPIQWAAHAGDGRPRRSVEEFDRRFLRR
ncbi:MAG: hypothetical protein U0Q16_22565 [Bryobacteraceae bacterium]